MYIFTVLYHLTDQGKDVRLAQYMFAVIYLVSLIVIFDIYRRAKKVHIFIYMLKELRKETHLIVPCLGQSDLTVPTLFGKFGL